MITDIVMIVLAVAAVGWLLSHLGGGARVGSPSRPTPPEPPPSAPSGGIAPDPASPGGGSRDPWRDGDGAFVDGYIVGRYVERSHHRQEDPVPGSDEALHAGDDDPGDDAGGELLDPHGGGQHRSGTDAADELEFEDEQGIGWGGGFGDGFDDGFDDDW